MRCTAAVFTPNLRAEDDSLRFLGWLRGTPVALATPGLRVTAVAAQAGFYELEVNVFDVYGRLGLSSDYVDVRSPFAR